MIPWVSARRGIAAAALIAAAPLAAQAIDVQRVVSPAGIEAWFVQDETVPVLSLEAAFLGGANRDPADRAGRARFVAAMLDEGAGERDSRAFQTALEDLALRLRFDADREAITISLSTLTDVADESFALLGDALTAPRFDPEPLERVRAQITARLQRQANDLDAVASQALRRARYGDHPLGRSVWGEIETVSAATRDDLLAVVSGDFARDRLLIAAVGDVAPARLGALIDRAFGALPATGAGDWRIPPATPGGQGAVIVSDIDAPQSQGFFAQPGLLRSDPDWYAAVVVNRVLGGGGFTARLVEEVREKRGLAYSVYARLVPYDSGPMIFGSVATQNARFQDSWDVIRAEWARMAQEGPTQAELDDAKANLIGSFPLRLTSTGRIAEMLISMRRDGLPIDHLDTRAAQIAAVTLEDAKRVAARLYDVDALTLSVAGRPDDLVPTPAR